MNSFCDMIALRLVLLSPQYRKVHLRLEDRMIEHLCSQPKSINGVQVMEGETGSTGFRFSKNTPGFFPPYARENYCQKEM